MGSTVLSFILNIPYSAKFLRRTVPHIRNKVNENDDQQVCQDPQNSLKNGYCLHYVICTATNAYDRTVGYYMLLTFCSNFPLIDRQDEHKAYADGLENETCKLNNIYLYFMHQNDCVCTAPLYFRLARCRSCFASQQRQRPCWLTYYNVRTYVE